MFILLFLFLYLSVNNCLQTLCVIWNKIIRLEIERKKIKSHKQQLQTFIIFEK